MTFSLFLYSSRSDIKKEVLPAPLSPNTDMVSYVRIISSQFTVATLTISSALDICLSIIFIARLNATL